MRALYVLYDSACGLCSWMKKWCLAQPAYVDLVFVAAGTPAADRILPMEGGNPPEELVVVSDQGGVWRGDGAWLMCLWALEEYRDWANRLASPTLLSMAREAFHMLSNSRRGLSKALGLRSDAEIAGELKRWTVFGCRPQPRESWLT